MFWRKKSAQEAQFREVLQQWAGFVRGTLRQIDSRMPEADLEELEQDVRMKLWQVIVEEGQYDKPASFLRKLILNVSIDASRRRAVRGGEMPHDSLSDPETLERLSADSALSGLGNRMELQIELQDLMRSVAEQDPMTAKALGLYLQGFNVEEIAHLLDWSEAKARNTIYRLLDRLRAEPQNKT